MNWRLVHGLPCLHPPKIAGDRKWMDAWMDVRIVKHEWLWLFSNKCFEKANQVQAIIVLQRDLVTHNNVAVKYQ